MVIWYNGLISNTSASVSRVYATGGFKKPRELTWISGTLLSILTVSFGVTGYAYLEVYSYWASKIVTAVPESFNDIWLGLHFSLLRKQGISGPL